MIRITLLVVLLAFVFPHALLAQQLLCSAIRPGETAGGVARRISGDAADIGRPWFQIVNPATGLFVPKSGYDRVRAGWQACIVNEPVVAPSGKKGARDVGFALDWNVALWGLLVVLIAASIHGASDYFGDRAEIIRVMRRFGERFVQEFERPLIQPVPGDRPIESRLRFVPRRGRLDVHLAPAAGRRYPNLADHKKNVEYDVGRVAALLRQHPFVAGRLYARGRWVVVPFQLITNNRQAGVQ